MKRRDFLIKTTAATTIGAIASTSKNMVLSQGLDIKSGNIEIKIEGLGELSDEINEGFKSLLKWLNNKGWIPYLSEVTGIQLDNSNPLDEKLFTPINRKLVHDGFDDFAGNRFIQPGLPAMSLLYHALASPRVKLKSATDDCYPSLEQLDLLENYIYGLQKIQETAIDNNTVLAVFAYEYRPAFKTPHQKYADLVFSRTGIARVGDKKMNYDAKNRCHINQPTSSAEKKNIAVIPARYGLFIAQKVDVDEVYLMRRETGKVSDNSRYFLKPLRKIFNGDKFLNDCSIQFCECHVNNKLRSLIDYPKAAILIPTSLNKQLPPFVKMSCTTATSKLQGHTSDMVKLTETGSSAWLSSIPCKLVREAYQGKERLRFKVPLKWETKYLSNRRYTTFKVTHKKSKDGRDLIITDFILRSRLLTRFSEPRNAPMFVNIRNKVTENNGENPVYLGNEANNLEGEIEKEYWVALFEDSICDGCVSINVIKKEENVSPDANAKHLFDSITNLPLIPAFSLVIAPDFFPQVDGCDLIDFNDCFLEGGTEDLSSGRRRANENIPLPGKATFAFPKVFKPKKSVQDWVFDTVMAVLSARPNPTNNSYIANEDKFKDQKQRDYISRNSLPDTASKIFYPGWDVTYSGIAKYDYYSTIGLGSPFPEDMKLCAAANGMWPAASPDAARTFQGSLDPILTGIFKKRRPPTAVPLMDCEIGFHKDSPAVKQYKLNESYGWDGEQGPFLEILNKHIYINFTDLGRADYVDNAVYERFDMSLLRDLEAKELISRMECLRNCINAIDKSNDVAHTRLWLVSSEKVHDWSKGAEGNGIASEIAGTNNSWAKAALQNVNDSGYLFVFVNAESEGKDEKIQWVNPNGKGKRRRQKCLDIYACKVTEKQVTWCKIPGDSFSSATKIKWYFD